MAVVVLGAGAAVVAATAHTSGSTSAAVMLPSEMESAKRTCADSSAYVTVEDQGHTLNIDGMGEEEAGVDYSSIGCIVKALGMPSAVSDQIDNTRALDGMQQASWKSFSATWNYHPNSGLSLVITGAG